MADDAIVQEIILKGQDDIKAGFASIERAGLQMFQSLEAASGASPLQKFALGVSGAIAAVTAITAGLFKWSESASIATAEMGRLASATGTTIEDFSTLAGALHIDPDKFATELKRMAVRVDSEWKQIQQSQKEAANLIISDTLAIQNAYLALERATVQLGNADKTVSNQQVANSLAVKNAKIGLAEAIERQRIAEGGEVDPAFNERLNQEKAALAVKQARLALSEAQKKADEDATLAANKMAQSANDAETSVLKLAQAQEQAAEHSKNSIANLTKFVENLAKGVTDTSLEVNASADNIIKGLIASVGPGISALQEFKGTFASVATAPPALKDVMLQLADVFKNMEDGATKTAIAVAFFGRTIGEKMVAELSKGKEAILAEQKALKDLGLELTGKDVFNAAAMEKAVDKLSNTLSILSKQFALAFAPSFTALIKEINSAIQGSSNTFREFGKTIEQSVTPVVVAFFETLTGANLRKNLELTPEQVVSVDKFKSTFTAIKDVVVFAFGLIAGAAKVLASVLNTVFQTDTFSGFDIAIGALLLRFGGLLGVIITVGLALNKLSGGTMFEKIGVQIEDLGKSWANFKTFLEEPFSLASIQKFLDGEKKIREEQEKRFSEIDARKKQSLTEEAEGPIKEGLAIATKAGEDFKATLDKAATSATTTASKVGGIGTSADASRAKVKSLASEIRLLDSAKKTDQPSAGGDIEFKSVTKDLVKGTGGDASKSFGQTAIEINKATEAAANLFDEFGQIDGEIVSIGGNIVKSADDLKKMAKIAEDEKTDLIGARQAWVDFDQPLPRANQPEPAKSKLPILVGVEDQPLKAVEEELKRIAEQTKQLWNDFNTGIDTSKVVAGLDSTIDSLENISTEVSDLMKGVSDEIEKEIQGTELTVKPVLDLSDFGKLAELETLVASAIAGVKEAVVSPFRQAATESINALQPVLDFINRIKDSISGINLPSAPQGGGGSGFAEGGRVLGKPGIDTNLAWLTHNEFVQPVRAVKAFGLDFMEIVRRADIEGIVRWANKFKLPGFAAGGVVDWANKFSVPTFGAHDIAALPRFAAGGLVSWGNDIAAPVLENMSGLVDWISKFKLPEFNAGGLVSWADKISSPSFSADGVVRWLHDTIAPHFSGGGLVSWANKFTAPDFSATGSVDWLNKIGLPKFNLGGLVSWANNFAPQSLPSLQSISGIARWINDISLPKFASGGLVSWASDIMTPTLNNLSAAANWIHNIDLPKFATGGLVDWLNKVNLPAFGAGGRVTWDNVASLPGLAADGVASWFNKLDLPKFAAGGLVSWSNLYNLPTLATNGIADWISRMDLPKFNVGGLVDFKSLFNLPDLALGGVVKWMNGFDELQKFSTGGLVSFANKFAAVPSQIGIGSIDWLNSFDIPKFNAGGLVRWANDFTMPSISNISRAMNHNLSPIRIPAFAGGGLNVAPGQSQQTSAGHMTVDLRTDRGTFQVHAPVNTARELQRISVKDRLASAGPAPNWVGRRGR